MNNVLKLKWPGEPDFKLNFSFISSGLVFPARSFLWLADDFIWIICIGTASSTAPFFSFKFVAVDVWRFKSTIIPGKDNFRWITRDVFFELSYVEMRKDSIICFPLYAALTFWARFIVVGFVNLDVFCVNSMDNVVSSSP